MIGRAAMILGVLLSIGTRSDAQFLFVDVDRDSICTANDILPMGTDTVWIWLDTNHDAAGSEVLCPTGQQLTMSGYELTIYVSSLGGGGHISDPVPVGTWINKVPEFTVNGGQTFQPGSIQYAHVGYHSPDPPVFISAGRYLLGGLPLEMPQSGCNNAQVVGWAGSTSFTSECAGIDGDHRETLGVEFGDTCTGADACLGTVNTTWGSIKSRYR